MSTIVFDDGRMDAKTLMAWLKRSGFAAGPADDSGAARWVRPGGDARPGLPASAVDVRLARGEGGHLQVTFADARGRPVDVDWKVFDPVGPMATFVERHFRRQSAGVVARAARAWRALRDGGGALVLTLDGPACAGELGIALAPAIRAGLVDAVVSTGHGLEADLLMMLAREGCPVSDVPPAASAVVEALTGADPAATSHSTDPVSWITAALKRAVSANPHLRQRRVDSWVCAAIDRGVPVYVLEWVECPLGAAHGTWCRDHGIDPARGQGDEGCRTGLTAWGRALDARALGLLRVGAGVAGDLAASTLGGLAFHCAISMDSDDVDGAVEAARFSIRGDPTVITPIMLAYVMGL